MAAVDDLDDVVREFLVESHEGLDQLDRDLVALELAPDSKTCLASIFRTIHTIKGTCGFLGFGKLESVAHVGESLLSQLRDGRLVLDADITSALLAMVDAVRRMLADIEATGRDGDDDYAGLVARLSLLHDDAIPRAQARASLVEESAKLTATTALEGPELATASDVALGITVEKVVEEDGAREQHQAHSPVVTDTTVRVDVYLLDELLFLADELVLARNQILGFASRRRDAGFRATSRQLDRITTELRECVMKTRMLPIGTMWSRFPRLVRDVALACGKQVRVEMDGGDTELDKTVIEAIKDPLTHVVRNAVDHGIESPGERAASGKPTEGRLLLRAFNDGGQVHIEISDDGAGIVPAKLRAKAAQRGLVPPDRLARMSDDEILGLVFLPGFSTAERITNVSGRGVGMDVVKTNIEKIGGAVDIRSRVGRGTTLRIRIPLACPVFFRRREADADAHDHFLARLDEARRAARRSAAEPPHP